MPKNLRNLFYYLLMFCYIIKLSKNLYFVSIMQKTTSESSIITMIQKKSCFMKLEFRIFLELFFMLSDFEPQCSYKIYSYKIRNAKNPNEGNKTGF